MKKTLKKLELLRISYCQIDGKFHKIVLPLCPNLKRLTIKGRTRSSIIIGTNNEWLCRQYPTLQRFDLVHFSDHRRIDEVLKIDELKTFLEIDANVRTMSIVADSLWMNRNSLIDSTINLDVLNILIADTLELNTFYVLLNDLQERGFYKRLHVTFSRKREQEAINQLATLNALRKLDISSSNYRISLSTFNKLVELRIHKSREISDWECLSKDHLKLEVIEIAFASFDEISMPVKWAANLSKIKVNHFEDGTQLDATEHILDLEALNRERELFRMTRQTEIVVTKVSIYVNEKIYLPTKWAFNGREFSLIRLKRIETQGSDVFWI